MKCRYSEQDVALFVEGDLEPARLLQIEAHLSKCQACRARADELRESQSIFKSLRRDTVSTAALGQVRTRVLVEVSGLNSRTPWGRRVERWLYQGARRGYALAGVGLAVLMVIGLWSLRTPELPMPAPLPPGKGIADFGLRLPELKAPPVPEIRNPKSEIRSPQQQVRRTVTPKPDEPRKQLVVKLLTDDPNIVIYWLVDQNGG